MQINIHSDSIDKALTVLKDKMGDNLKFTDYETWGHLGATSPAIILEKSFEHEYHCKIVNEDEFGLHGHISFTEEKYATAFVLRFGGNDEPQQWQPI